MDREYIRNELNEIFAMLDPVEDAALQECVAPLLEEDHELTESAYEIAGKLRIAAPEKPLPQFVFDFIVELYEDEIENGNEDAMNDLGALYYDGRGCEQDYSKAIRYYEMAAENGSSTAQENLGYCYYYGRSVPVDYKKAYHYFALGALRGMPVSLYKLGDMYQNGYYVEKNEKEAFFIYDRCLRLLDKDTESEAAGPVFLRLGNAFLYGRGVEADHRVALLCFQRAELFLFDMVRNGEDSYGGSLQAAIEGQQKAREMLYPQIC